MTTDQDQVLNEYDAGLFVPAYCGNRFTVAKKGGICSVLTPARSIGGRDYDAERHTSDRLHGFIVDTLAQAQEECDRRNDISL